MPNWDFFLFIPFWIPSPSLFNLYLVLSMLIEAYMSSETFKLIQNQTILKTLLDFLSCGEKKRPRIFQAVRILRLGICQFHNVIAFKHLLSQKCRASWGWSPPFQICH